MSAWRTSTVSPIDDRTGQWVPLTVAGIPLDSRHREASRCVQRSFECLLLSQLHTLPRRALLSEPVIDFPEHPLSHSPRWGICSRYL